MHKRKHENDIEEEERESETKESEKWSNPMKRGNSNLTDGHSLET
jgi:hypothetical protein